MALVARSTYSKQKPQASNSVSPVHSWWQSAPATQKALVAELQ
jgi:hypothetical protein